VLVAVAATIVIAISGPAAAGPLLVTGFIVIVGNPVADILYRRVDPAIGTSSRRLRAGPG
jgi:hypothetical protein